MQNTMWFRLRHEGNYDHKIKGENDTLLLIMHTLFRDDDFVFTFEVEPPFENISSDEKGEKIS